MGKVTSAVIGGAITRFRFFRQRQRDKRRIANLAPVKCEVRNLCAGEVIGLERLVYPSRFEEDWFGVSSFIAAVGFPSDSGGVCETDQRLIFGLVRILQANCVLECGTHIGASTTAIAAAMLKGSESERPRRLTTVDIRNVNCYSSQPWKVAKAQMSPQEVISRLGAESMVQFVQSGSLQFMRNCAEKFDLIFLDGDHSAETVYQEIPQAINCLNRGGVVLLHDYFPSWRSTLGRRRPITGPFSAVSALIAQGVGLSVIPLGPYANLPEASKRSSSLALVSRPLKLP